jgi:predicted ATP-grasp superfamily ATP-dependent carboligase
MALSDKQDERPVLIVTADNMLQFVADHQEQLARHYAFIIPRPRLFDAFLDKAKTITLLRNHGIDMPRSWPVSDIGELREVAKQVEYPCILKPAHSYLWKQKFNGKKVSIIQTPDQLESQFLMAKTHNLTAMVQEIIPGDDTNLCTFLGYYNGKSEPLCMITKRKLRQHPPRFGDGSFQISQHIPEIIEISDRFLRSISYTGLASIEYKLDPRDNRFKFIENNMRTISGNELLARCGADMVYVYYRDMIGAPVRLPGPFREGIKFSNFPWDCGSFYRSKQMGVLTLREWIRSYKGDVCHASLAWDDLLPFFYYYGILLKKLIRKKKAVDVEPKVVILTP